jgi:Lon protease-like protein
VVTLVKGKEVRTLDSSKPTGDAFAQEQFADVGTLARIVEFSAPQAGLMVVRCVGGERFHIQNRSQLKHGLWVADANHVAADAAMPIPQDLQPIAHALSRLIENQRSGEAMFEPLPIEQPYRFDDCAWVANRWCDLLALPSHVKQNLLQLDNPLLRLELVGDILGKLEDV